MALPHLSIYHPAWLTANTFSLAGLIIYRSPLVKRSDRIFAPVARFIKQHDMRLVLNRVICDESMMFGKAELEIYHKTCQKEEM